MKKILVNYAHPNKAHSTMNSALQNAIQNLEGVTVNDLYAQYPDFLIDVEREQSLCESHDVIIFQHPFYWYSSPAIVKEWMDLVLEHGWAYGSKGRALQGKVFMQAITGGGGQETYCKEGYNRFTVKELTSPMQATANLCQMHWLPPFAVLGIHRGLNQDQITEHSEDYRGIIIALRDGKIDLDEAQTREFINDQSNAFIKGN